MSALERERERERVSHEALSLLDQLRKREDALNAQRELVMNHLAAVYSLKPGDEVKPDGSIIRAPTYPPADNSTDDQRTGQGPPSGVASASSDGGREVEREGDGAYEAEARRAMGIVAKTPDAFLGFDQR